MAEDQHIDGCGGGGKKQCIGRPRRTEVKFIEDAAAREVTFCKRRSGLFSKASEVSILCGVEVAIIAYSPHDNPFVFGSPSADAVISRFTADLPSIEAGLPNPRPATCNGVQAIKIPEYVRREQEVLSRVRKMKNVRPGGGDGRLRKWWEDPVDVEELEYYIECLERLQEKVSQRAQLQGNIDTAAAAVSAPATATPPPSSSNGSGGNNDAVDISWLEAQMDDAVPWGGGDFQFH